MNKQKKINIGTILATATISLISLINCKTANAQTSFFEANCSSANDNYRGGINLEVSPCYVGVTANNNEGGSLNMIWQNGKMIKVDFNVNSDRVRVNGKNGEIYIPEDSNGNVCFITYENYVYCTDALQDYF